MTLSIMPYTVETLLAGMPAPFRNGEQSAIAKAPLNGVVTIRAIGLAGDEQADRKVHGGPHMAVHQYPLDHHDYWRAELGALPLLDDHGAFGSNIAVRGLTETQVHIGDRFRLGSALMEVSQPRQPCWKIEHRFGRKNMVANILKTGRCGWYYRVIEQGEAQAGDRLIRQAEGDPHWTVALVLAALWGDPKAASDEQLHALAALPALTPKLQDKARARLD